MALRDLSRLKSQLLTSGLSQRDNPLFQVINALIGQLELIGEVLSGSSGGGGGGSSIINNTFIQQFLNSGDDGGGDGEIGPPGIAGPQGAAGITGAAGPVTLGPMGLDGDMGEESLPIPGPVGATGATGPAATIPWEGNIVACAGDGNPNIALSILQASGFVGPTPSNISTSSARVSYFILNTAITVANIRWYGIGAVTDIYHIAIYRASDDVRMSADNTITTAANTFGAVADSFVLAADTLYYCVVSADTTGATAGLAALGTTIAQGTGQIRVLPTAWPGNLDFDNAFVNSYAFGVVAVTAGALPDPGNAPTAFSANLTGGMPAIFLDAA